MFGGRLTGCGGCSASALPLMGAVLRRKEDGLLFPLFSAKGIARMAMMAINGILQDFTFRCRPGTKERYQTSLY
jgi:hypothetical protein